MSEQRDPAVRAVIDILAPVRYQYGERVPIFEWAKEETPTDAEIEELAVQIVAALREVKP